jgi:hypothetical protein
MDKKDEIWDRIDKMFRDCKEMRKECGLLRKEIDDLKHRFFKLDMRDIRSDCYYEDRALMLTKKLRDQ